MTDLERITHEGVIVDDVDGADDALPYASRDDAERDLTEGLTLLRDGLESAGRGQALLEEARRREAWRVLGYGSWQDCLAERTQAVFRTVIDTDARIQLAARLRAGSATTRQIAEILGTAPSTASRDLARAREGGLLENEPERVEGADGKVRGTRRMPAPREGGDQPAPRRRGDLAKTVAAAIHTIEVKARTLGDCLKDDRWGRNRAELAPHRHDLERALETLDRVLEDLTAAADQAPTPS